jgi:hypothetical protein
VGEPEIQESTVPPGLQPYSQVAPVMHEEAAELVAGMFRR